MIHEELFGYTKDGSPVTRYTLTNERGMVLKVLDLGCIIQQVLVPDKNGEPVDVVLGYDDVAAYENDTTYVGALVGRHANRLGGSFIEIDGQRFDVTCNEGKNQLHGGPNGFHKKIFSAVCEDEDNILKLSCLSADGEEGYPGNLQLEVHITLTDDNAIVLSYTAYADRDTVVNITNHSYFNLNGSGSIADHTLRLVAKEYTELGEEMLPTGRILPVAGTPLDFTAEKAIGKEIDSDTEQMKKAGGYDHNFVLDKAPGTLTAVALLQGDVSGIRMVCATTCPGLQLYTANFLAGCPTGKGGVTYQNRDGVCLETQYFPNSMNCENFKKPILRSDDTWCETTLYQFGV